MRKTAVTAISGLVLATGPVLAQEAPVLEPALQRLLDAAARSGNADDLADALRLIALSEGRDVAFDAAARMGRLDAAQGVLGPVIAEAAADQPVEPAPADDTPQAAPAESGTPAPPVWRRAPAQVASAFYGAQSDLWDGRVRLGARFDSGNSDRQDYLAGLEIKRALAGWGFEGAIEYAYSEVNSSVGRDELIANARGEREAGERFTYYASGEYEQDALSGYDWTTFLGAGVGYRLIENDTTNFVLRAGPGIRVLSEPDRPNQARGALDLGADYSTAWTDAVSFSSESSLLVSDKSRADQRFVVSTALGEVWALELKLRYRHEFEPEPGFEESDTRTDISIVREF
ncbi:DUF481 domain-containing protein [Marinicauda sp. Alg238-R41]|uniref:DUF481 domain-containing protein n=1 Tax=Marinicauda sp. Alg238-R41 TaxID=2993447 RepID=UPI0022E4D2A0|nr:DUF481 domain-containing protein [Marinicauda sp. Alg238-R41]